MRLFLALLLIPIVEIGLFIEVGGRIGLWPTIAIVLVTALLGSYLIRQQGLSALAALRSSVSKLGDPSRPLFDGAMVIFAGALLLTPGFLTDSLGLLLLLPPVRTAIFGYMRQRITVAGAGFSARPRAPGDVVDGDYEVVEPEAPHLPPGRH
jgi:UPF0716 protein FxsA